jgi:hypothetical protein
MCQYQILYQKTVAVIIKYFSTADFLCGHHKVYLMYNKCTPGKFIMGLKSDYEIETPEEM